MCPRGQFVQRNSDVPHKLCDGQENNKCAEQCYTGNQSGLDDQDGSMKKWIHQRMDHMRSIVKDIDLFIAPSRTLYQKFVSEFNIPESKMRYMDYGFDLDRLKNRERQKEGEFVFGYIGTHIPAKGIQDLIIAFGKIPEKNVKLRIWGRRRGEETPFLKTIIEKIPSEKQEKIEWMGEYENQKITTEVFNKVDAIVVPSIWLENSPLVIHEAQQLQIPVITTNLGGMAEYVHHEKNGLLFELRNTGDLANQMRKFIRNPDFAKKLGARGYLFSPDGQIPDIKEQSLQIESIYKHILDKKKITYPKKPGPWRITFDTNPDTCNYKCIMCECFSPYSTTRQDRVSQGIPRRLMDIQLVRKILEEMKDTPLREIIPSTMGEPLLYKSFDEIIKMCHEFGLKLNLTTNGSFPIKGAEEWARLLLPVLSDIKISWNGATKETNEKIMLFSKWEKMIGDLTSFLKSRDDYALQGGNRPTVTLQMTFLETNLEDIPSLVEKSIDLGVDRIKGHHLWTHFEEIKSLSMRRNQDAIERWNVIANQAIKIAHSKKLENGSFIKLENIHPLSIEAEKDIAPDGRCPFLGQEAWINTEGKFSPCCAPDKQRDALGYFGNVEKTSFSDIWLSETYQGLRKTYLQHPLCKGCDMKKSLN